ncbi:hypothetical protein PSEUBRA_006025 [Kalmanozyma brasiliensis GHG001]|uniref:BTB domain-containing protein n=1 Tax=Kalmanozyma brasiliensis (strain GHG001) TaxID=1365824 RepID=V5E3I8_KALBG|nr:uncharacterized protein PSEUBRA_006025 [Kalmanozyma brasiliensis GHG001]EST04741.1 hypothetical protein PSEUBRA_006025 [Kalmanozyma brasiliensis GHG001]
MAAVDVIHRSSKPLPTPRLGGNRKPISRPRKAYIEADEEDQDDAASLAASEDAEAADAFTLVPHVAEQTLHAVHSAIFGQPWADLELVVSVGGKREEVIYANSKVLKKACPALMRQISQTGRAELDTMEQEQMAAAAAAQGKNAPAVKREVRPQASRRSTSSLGLVDYRRTSRVGALSDSDESADEIERADKHQDKVHEEEYADSVAEQPKHFDEHDDGPQQDNDFFGDDDEVSPVGSRSKVAGTAPALRQAAPEVIVPPTFSRSSSRFGKLMKFMNKDKSSPTAELEQEIPFTPVGNATHTDYASENRGRVRRYSAANTLTSAPAAPRGSNAARVAVTGCSPATLQALIFYLYTGHATFASRLPAPSSRRYRPTRRDSSSSASLHSGASSIQGSDEDVEAAPAARVSKSPSFPPVFSATAAYCVGRQLGLRDLATKAFDHICLELSPKTVLADLLSPFVDRFDEVQRAHLAYIAENWDRVKRRPDFEHTVGRLVMGEYRESRKALLKLFAKLSVA